MTIGGEPPKRLRSPATREWGLKVVRALLGRRPMAAGADWRTRQRAVRQGFLPSSYLLYDIPRNGRRDYVTDSERWRRTARQLYSHALNGDATHLLRDKVAFHLMCRQFGVPTPEVLAVLRRGRPHALGERPGPAVWADLRSMVDEHGRVVVKPVTGAGGRDVVFLESSDGRYRMNETECEWRTVEDRLRHLDYYLVSECVQQAPYSTSVFPGSTNVVRLLTVRRRGQNAPILAAAVHRFGCASSRPVDNFSRGGLSVAIDVATGTLGQGVSYPTAGRLVWQSHHPDTGAPIEGVRIPGWEGVRDGVLGVADTLSFLPYVGWDVVVTDEEGGWTIIEGNSSPDLDLMQVHRPLLSDPEVRSFYVEQGVLGSRDSGRRQP